MTEKIKWSGRTTSHSHKFNGWEERKADGHEPLRQQLVLDVQWSTIPVEVEADVKQVWRDSELGNDRYIDKYTVGDMLEEDCETPMYPALEQYLAERGVKEGTEIWIHWWW